MSNEELQKAIDDITNENAAPAPAPVMPAAAMPEGLMPEVAPAEAMPASDAAAAAVVDPIAAPAPAPEVPAVPEVAAPVAVPVAVAAPTPAPAPAAPAAPAVADVRLSVDGLINAGASERVSNVPTGPSANLVKVEQDALRELFPLMNKLNIDPVQKFGIYKDIIALTHEQSAIEEAHATVQQIEDEQIRADALLELLQIIAEHKH